MDVRKYLQSQSASTFLIDEKTGEQYSYQQIFASACSIATFLLSKDLKKDDKLVVMLDNSILTAKIYFACLYAGITVVPANPAWTEEQIHFVFKHSEAKLLLTIPTYQHIQEKGLPTLIIDDQALIENQEKIIPSEYLDSENIAIIVYTSGTTSQPKGVIHTIADLVGNGLLFIDTLGITSANRFYNMLPMTYLGGYYNLLLIPYLAKASVVIANAFNPLSIIRFWDNIIKHEINTLWLVPTIMAILMEIDRSTTGAKYCREKVLLALVGTAPLPQKLKMDFEAKYGLQICENYALSETLFLTSHLPKQTAKGVGKLLAQISLKIINKKGEEAKCNEEGEIAVCTPFIMNHYLGMEHVFNKKHDEWFYTGDVGYIDNEGYLYITGRKKDLIIKGGVNISPAAIEEVIYKHVAVKECAALGIPHALSGEEVIAVVTLHADADFKSAREEILALCKQDLAAVQQPIDIVKIDELPHTFTGKIQKAKLRAWLIEGKTSAKEADFKPAEQKEEHFFKPSRVVREASQALSIAYNTLVYELQRENKEVTVLSLGEAFFDLPLFDFTTLPFPSSYHYSHSRGVPELRNVLAEYFQEQYDVKFDPEKEIIITAGSKIAIYMALMALINPGDEVIIPEPAWVSYPEQVKLCHGVPVSVPYDETVYDFEKYITNRTKVLIVNNPNNPRGNVLSLDEIAHLYKLAEKYNLYILSDEAYSDFVVNKEQFISIGNFDKEFKFSIICNSISKNFGISGWRIGYVISNHLLIDQILKLNQHLITCPATILENYIAKHFYSILSATKPQIVTLLEKRKNIIDYIDKLGLTSLQGDTTFYIFLSIAESRLGSDDFCMRLLKESHICVVPGIGYGKSCDKFVRVSIGAEPLDKIFAALDKIKALIQATKLADVVNLADTAINTISFAQA